MKDPQFILGVFAILVGVGGMMMGVKMILAKQQRPSLNRIQPAGRPATIMGAVLFISGALLIAGYFLFGRHLLETKTDKIENDGLIEIDLSEE